MIRNEVLPTKSGLHTFPVSDCIPEGWQINEKALTAPLGYVWITNGKSFFSGERKSAIVKVV